MISTISINKFLDTITIEEGLVVLIGFKKQAVTSKIPYVFDSKLLAENYLNESKKTNEKIYQKT